jgi:putative membrane protein insertion efficiency factor
MVCLKTPLFISLVVLFLFVAVTTTRPDARNDISFIRNNRVGHELEAKSDKSRLDLKNRTNELEMAGLAVLRLYQVVLPSQDGPRCMFHPSCSEYAKLALAQHGIFTGSLMAIDRYLRCNGVNRELYPYDPVRRKLLDPVPNATAGSLER